MKEPLSGVAALTAEGRAARATVAGLASTAISTVLQIATIPIVLKYWGAERYGVWLAVVAGFLMARTVDSGYIAYVGNRVNVLYHENQEELRRTLGSSLTICAALGALQLLLCTCIVAAGIASTILGVAPESEEGREVGIALIVLVLAWVLAGSFPSIIHRLLVPAGLLVNSIWWGLGYQVAQFTVVIGAALVGATIFQTAVAYAIVQAAVFSLSVQYVRWKLPRLYPWWHGGRMRIGLRDLWQSTALTANSGAQQAGISGIVLIISSMLGTQIVAAYTTVRTFANLWTSLGGVIGNALSPEIVRYYATNQYEKVVLAFRASALFSGLVVNLSLLAILPFAETIYAIWTKEALPFDRVLFLYLVAGVSVWNAGFAYSTFLTAINSLRSQLLLTLTRSCTTLGVTVASIGFLGLASVGLGIFLGEVAAFLLTTFVFVPRIVADRGGRLTQLDQAEGAVTSLPVIATSVFGLWFETLPTALVAGAAACVLCFGCLAWLRLPRDARARATNIFRR